MTDTIRTISYLLGNEFQDGQSGTITAQFVRDLIVTLQSLLTPGGSSFTSSLNALAPSSPNSIEMQHLAGGLRLPDHNGVAIDRTGTTDVTTALNNWLTALVTNGDYGFLPAGNYKTSGELVAPNGSGLWLSGAGAQQSRIFPTGTTYNFLRVNVGNGDRPSGKLSGIGLVGPTANPTSKKAAIVVDGSKEFVLDSLSVEGQDIGYDFINNCFNSSGHNLSLPRTGGVNIGMLLRDGSQSGSDLQFFNCNLFGDVNAVSLFGGGGGFHFWGGEMGSYGTAGAVVGDNNGVIQLGWDYINNVENAGVTTTLFSGVGFEGWHTCHAVRSYGPNNCVFHACAFDATNSGAIQALDIIKMTDAQAGLIAFRDCALTGFFSNNALASIAGSYKSNVVESDWYIPPSGYQAGSAGNLNWLQGLMIQSGINSGHVFYDTFLGLGNVLLRFNSSTNAIEYSKDSAVTWAPIA